MQFPLRQSVFSLWSSTSALATPTVPTTGPVCWKPFWMILETMEEQRFWQGPEMREHQAVIPPGRCRCEERRKWSSQYLPMKAASASSSGNLTLISLRLVFRHHLGRDSGRFQKAWPARFRYRKTQILLYYGQPGPYSTAQELYFEFIPDEGSYVEEGIWSFYLSPVSLVSGRYDFWLPSAWNFEYVEPVFCGRRRIHPDDSIDGL